MTNGLLSFDMPAQPVAMSSREISELTGKRHPDVVREVFDSARPVMLNLQHRMIWGECSPDMFRSAMRRLNSMLNVAGETGDFKSEAEIVGLMAQLFSTALTTLYH
jgi:phage regulator Rha-like protein